MKKLYTKNHNYSSNEYRRGFSPRYLFQLGVKPLQLLFALCSLLFAFPLKLLPHKLMRRLSATQRLFLNMVITAVILVFGIWIVTGLLNPEQTKAAWFDGNWLYRTSIPITNSSGSELTNYQILIATDTARMITEGKLQSDCDDLRIVNTNGAVLPHWVETGAKGCNTAVTNIWVKVPVIPTSGGQLFLYYGNTSAQNVQNGNKVFELFDDFSGNSLNSTKWSEGTIGATSGTAFSVAGGNLAGGNTNRFVRSVASYTGDYITETRAYTTTSPVNGYTTVGFFASASDSFGILDHNGTSFYRNDGTWVNFAYSGTGQWNRDKVKVVGTNATYYRTGETTGSPTASATNTGISSEHIRLGARYDNGAYDQNFSATWDWILVRKAVATEPTTSIASEEQSPGPVAYWKFHGNLQDSSGRGYTLSSQISSAIPKYADGINGKAIDFTTDDWGTTLTWVNSTTLQDSSKSWTTNQWAGYEFITNYDVVGGYCRTTIVSNTTTNLTINGTCSSWTGGKTYRIKKSLYVARAVNYGTQNVSVGVWYKRTSSKADSNNTIFRSYGDDFAIEAYDTTITGYIDGYTNSFSCTVNGTDNKWHYAAITYDGTTVRLYYDGKQCNTRTQTSTLSNNEAVSIGSRNDGYSAFFEGYIDEFKIYPYTRTNAQVQTDFTSRGSVQGVAMQSGGTNNSTLSNGLVGYWKMDEATWNGTSGEVVDSSGNGNNGTSVLGALASPSAKFGNSGYFAGNDEAISIADSTSLDLGDTLTISLWAKRGVIGVNNYIMQKDAGPYAIGFNASNQLYLDMPGTGNVFTSTAAFTDTTSFHHIVFAKKSGSLLVYFDGAVVPGTFTNRTLTDNASALYLGSNSGNTSSRYAGNMDEVRLYNRQLSPDEILQLYNFAPGPIFYTPLDEGTGTTTADVSGNNYTGTFAGSTSPEWTQGKYGKGLKFTRGSTNRSAATVSTGPLSNLRNHSVSFWFKFTQLPDASYRKLFGYHTTSDRNPAVWTCPSLLSFHWKLDPGNTGSTCQGPTGDNNSQFTLNQWYHIEITKEGTVGVVYINGTRINALTFVDVNGNGTGTMYLGSDTGYGSPGFVIDEFKIYNYARTPGQVVSDMNAGHPLGGSPVGSQVGYWKFDEGYGTNARDSGPNRLDGTITSGIAWNNNGFNNKALLWDGTANRAVTIGDQAALDMGTNNFTLTAWMKKQGTNYHAIVEKRGTGLLGYLFIVDYPSIGQASIFLNDTNGSQDVYTFTNAGITQQNKWYHLAVGVNRTAGTTTLYVDGKPVQTVNTTGTTGSIDSDGSFRIGYDLGGTAFNGMLDDVKVYSSLLTNNEIKIDYNHNSSLVLGAVGTASDGITASNSAGTAYCVPGDTSTCSAPIAQYNFEEKSGASIQDISGNGNTATKQNTPIWVQGKIGSAMNFDDSADYLSVSGIAVGPTWTVSTWSKFPLAANGTYRTLIRQGANVHHILVDPTGLLGVFNSAFYSSGYDVDTLSAGWHHITAVGSGGSTTFYIDGKSIGTSAQQITTNITQIGGIGSQNWGTIDEMRIYNYARTAAQIAYDYNRGKPVAQWKMDECQGSTINDSSGNGLSGTITIGATGTQTSAGTCQTASTAWGNGATGKFNSSLNFDGTDDYAVFTGSNIAQTTSYSVSAWIYTSEATAAWDTIILNGSGAGCNTTIGYDLVRKSATGQIRSGFYDSGGTEHSLDSIGSISTNTWTHLASTYDYATGSQKIYINGRLDNSGSVTPATAVRSNTTACFGRNNVDYFNGKIDDAQIFNYALTKQQVQNVMNQSGAVRFGPLTGSP